jgi:hypothetical protein
MGASKKRSGGKKEKEKAPSIEEIESQIEKFRVLGQSVKDVKKELTKYKRELKKDPKKATPSFKKVQGHIEFLSNEWNTMRNGYKIRLLELSVNELEEKGEKTDDLLKMVDKVSKKGKETKKQGKEIDSISKKFIQMAEGHPDRLYPEAISSFERSLNSFEEIAGSKGDLVKHKKYFKKLLNLLKKGDLKNILVYANLLYTTTQSDIGEDIAKDRFKVIKEEITSMMDTMEEFKKFGLDSEPIENELKKLRKGLDPSKFSEVQSTLNRLNKNISRTEKEYFRRKASVAILDSQDLIQEYGSLIDLKDQENKLEQLQGEIRTTSPKKFMDESNIILDQIKDILYQNFEGQVQQRIQMMDQDLETSEFLSDQDREKILDLRNSVTNALQSRNITEAMEYLSLAESLFGQADGEISLVQVRSRYMDLLGNIEELLGENSEIEEIKNELSDLENLFLGDDVKVENILFEVEKGEEMIKSRLLDVRQRDFNDERSQIESLLDRMEMKPERREAIIKDLDDVQNGLANLNDDKYRSKMLDIKETLDKDLSRSDSI